MARTPTEGSGQGPDQGQPTTLTASESGQFHLPQGIDVGTLEMSRDGQDLVLQSPDGQSFVIEGYFSAADAPLIISASGALLTPALVQSFLSSLNEIEVAAGDQQANDQSPVAEISEVSGNASVTHADGTKETITVGTQIFEGDIIETDAKGAVNIHFADDSTFAISENARLAVDDFSFNPDDQSGSTGLSILRGVFMFTSGLVGRENPDAVHIETPVGSIGIRGTIIGGQINPSGQSQISVIEGAIVVRNGSGEQILSDQFETVQLTSFTSSITNIGTLDAARMSQSYNAVRSVSPALFTSIDDTARDAQPQQTTPQAEPDAPAQPQAEAPLPSSLNETPVVFQALTASTSHPNTPVSEPVHTTAPLPAAPVITTAPAPIAAPVQQQPLPPVQQPETPSVPVAVNYAPSFGTLASIPVSEGNHVYLTTAMIGATDPEGDSITYQVSAQTKGLIYVNGSPSTTFTQADVTNNLVKYVHGGDEPGGAGFTLIAQDAQGHNSAPQTFAVTVAQVNDAPTNITLSNNSIAEDANAGTVVGSAAGSDPDPSETITYSLVGSTTPFVINATTGAISLATGATLDYETIQSYSITVRATDSKSAYIDKTFTIDVGNVNELPDGITLTNDTINENSVSGTVVGTITAPSGGGSITYALTNDAAGRFVINAATGVISVASGATLNYEVAASHSIAVTISDGTNTHTENFTINLNDVNEAATSASIASTASFAEHTATASTAVVLSNITITDAENPANNPDYNFAVYRYDTATTSWVNDAASQRFAVVNNGGVWQLVAKAGENFDHESEATINLQVRLTDGTHATISSASMTVSITDTNEPGASVIFNNGDTLTSSPLVHSIVQGNVQGAIVGVVSSTDPDTTTAFTPKAQHYKILAVGNGYNINDFQLWDRVDDQGHSEVVLRVNPNLTNGLDFTTAQNINITIGLDADMNGTYVAGGEPTKIITVTGRNDMMLLESVNGQNGFMIENNARGAGPNGGARFGASLAAADLDGDGKNDLIFGAPRAQNGATEQSGGVYAMYNTSGFRTDAANGDVLLDRAISGGAGQGFFREQLSAGSDNFAHYGSQITALRRFDNVNGADIAVTRPGEGKVEILSGLTGNVITTIINLPTNSLVASNAANGEQLAGSIHVTSAGDLNRDGYTDLLVSSTFFDATGADAGRTVLIMGSASHPTTYDFAAMTSYQNLNPETAAGAHFGAAMDSLGDINGDGYDDVVISAPDAGTINGAGHTYIYLGHANAGAAVTNKIRISGVTAQEHLGAAVSGAGDFNGDGRGDLLLHSSTADAGRGAIYMVFGNQFLVGGTQYNISELNANGGSTPFNGATIQWGSSTDSTGIKIGHTIGQAGDFNGDGFDDIFIDVTRDLGGDKYDHTLFVLYGSNTGPAVYNLQAIMNDPAEAHRGYKIQFFDSTSKDISATAAGDLNGDGFSDLLISTPDASQSGNDHQDGEAYVVYGNNYDHKAVDVDGNGTATANNQSFVGGTANDTLLDFDGTTSHVGISFIGGKGDDTLEISNINAVRNFDGGEGKDTLRLFFSMGETASVNSGVDVIDLRNIGKMTGVETIAFADDSFKDVLRLDIRDILSMGATNGNQLVITDLNDVDLRTLNSGAERNTINLSDGTTALPNLATLGFTKDVGSNGVDMTEMHGNANGAYVYTQVDTGFKLIVDARLIGADTLVA